MSSECEKDDTLPRVDNPRLDIILTGRTRPKLAQCECVTFLIAIVANVTLLVLVYICRQVLHHHLVSVCTVNGEAKAESM